MTTTLTSWKEIAAYLGKGVRTVQRWEQRLGLPVRRPSPDSHIIFALPSELDAWVHHHQTASHDHPAQTVAKNRERRGQQHALLERLRTTYSLLEKNEQLLGENLTRLLTGMKDVQRRTASLNGITNNNKAAPRNNKIQSRSNAA